MKRTLNKNLTSGFQNHEKEFCRFNHPVCFFRPTSPKTKINAFFHVVDKLQGGNKIEISIVWGLTGRFGSRVKVDDIHKEICL